jgi:hypothetical protein
MRMRPFRRAGRPLAALVLVAALAAAAALAPAQPPGALPGPLSPECADAAAGSGPSRPRGFPRPLAWAWALAALGGALGAVAGELVAGGGRIDRPRRDRNGWAPGVAGKMTVGAVAALIVLSLNPPDGSWLRLVGVGLGSGVAGEAVLLAILASRRAQAAEKEREAAEAQAALGATLAIEKIETFRALSLAARRGAAPGQAEAGRDEAPGELAEFDQIVNTYAERAKAEIAAAG